MAASETQTETLTFAVSLTYPEPLRNNRSVPVPWFEPARECAGQAPHAFT